MKKCKVISRTDFKKFEVNPMSNINWESKLIKIKDTFDISGEKCLKYIKNSSGKGYDGKVINRKMEYFVSINLTSKFDNEFEKMPNHIILKTITIYDNQGEIFRIVEKATKITKKKISSTFFEIPADALFLFYNPSTLEFESKNEKSDKSKKKKSKKKKKSIKAIEEKEKL